MSRHETNDCPNRPYTCKYCSYKDTFYSVTEKHYSGCCSYPIYCPNNCKPDKIPRYQLQDYFDTSCPLQMVECEFSWAGCKVISKRQDLPKDYPDNIQQHLSFVAKACQELKKENARIKERLKMK